MFIVLQENYTKKTSLYQKKKNRDRGSEGPEERRGRELKGGGRGETEGRGGKAGARTE